MRLFLLLSLVLEGLHLSSQCPDSLVVTIPTISEADIYAEDRLYDQTSIDVRDDGKPTISELHVLSAIRYRHATTTVFSTVVNPSNRSVEHYFSVVLPETAFISEFAMKVNGRWHKAVVKAKKEGAAVYSQAVVAGQRAGYIDLDVRDSNEFSVAINIESRRSLSFSLIYEQFLSRNLGFYSNVIIINPQQIVRTMSVSVTIEDSEEITNLEVPDAKEDTRLITVLDSIKSIKDLQNYPVRLIEETPDMYQWGCSNIHQYLNISLDTFDLKRVYNTLDHKYDINNIVEEDEDPQRGFVLIKGDFDEENTSNLHLMAIVRPQGLRSLRDLRGAHLPLLLNIREKVYRTIISKYGIDKSQLRVFLQYNPAGDRLHIHFTHLDYHMRGTHSNVESMHLLTTVIDNIKMKSDYYQVATLSYLTPEPVYSAINSCYEIRKYSLAAICNISSTQKQVTWNLTPEIQKIRDNLEISGQFVVKYDVGLQQQNPQQCTVDGVMFLNFFAPANLTKLRKHVVFVLDYSGSMMGSKIEQLRDAMKQILTDLDKTDYFSLVIFEDHAHVLGPRGKSRSRHLNKEFIMEASEKNIELAISHLDNHKASGRTDMNDGLRKGCELANIGASLWTSKGSAHQPMIFFLTDGYPTETSRDTIISNTHYYNRRKFPIYSLAFGKGANYTFLRKLSLSNAGFAHRIYVDADASVQMNNVYRVLASPVMTNVTFHYYADKVLNHSITTLPVYNNGSEVVITGHINQHTVTSNTVIGQISGTAADGYQKYYPIVVNSVLKGTNTGKLEKMWTYLTIQKLIDDADSLDEGPEKEEKLSRARDISVKHSFVTPLTYLVVELNETKTDVNITKIEPERIPNIVGPQRIPVNKVKWLSPFLADIQSDNVTVSVQGKRYFLELKKNDESFGECVVNNNPGECNHFSSCALTIFKNYVSAFIPYQCPIPGNFLGVCCPNNLY